MKKLTFKDIVNFLVLKHNSVLAENSRNALDVIQHLEDNEMTASVLDSNKVGVEELISNAVVEFNKLHQVFLSFKDGKATLSPMFGDSSGSLYPLGALPGLTFLVMADTPITDFDILYIVYCHSLEVMQISSKV